jgi:hypothetical protein
LVDGLQYGDSIMVDGRTYTVRENRPLFDGVWNQVFLTGPISTAHLASLLLEAGRFLLLESGDNLLLEA